MKAVLKCTFTLIHYMSVNYEASLSFSLHLAENTFSILAVKFILPSVQWH